MDPFFMESHFFHNIFNKFPLNTIIGKRLSLSLQDKWDEMRSLNLYIIRSLSLVTTTMHKEWMLDYWKRLKRQIMIKDNNLSTCHAAGHDSHTQTTLHIPHVAHELVDRKSSFDHSLTKLKYFLPYTILPKKTH